MPIAFENGQGRVKGIVTYPGGDRVDWRLIEIPQGQHGTLDLQLTWKTPRPGLQVAFDVFDQWNAPVVATAASKRKSGRARSATINDAVGKYFVRIYAPKRGDAGAYTLVANFEQTETTGPVDRTKLPIPDPPKLPAVPETQLPCKSWDPNNPTCTSACPVDSPKGWPGCEKQVAAETAATEAETRRLARLECLKNQPKPFKTRIIHVEVNGDTVAVKLDTGTDEKPVTTGWTAKVLRAGSDDELANGKITVVSVGSQQTKGRSGLTVDQLNANPWVRLSPPAPDCP